MVALNALPGSFIDKGARWYWLRILACSHGVERVELRAQINSENEHMILNNA